MLGALVRHADLAAAPLVRERVPLLAEAARHVGHTAIRNRGTLGGSLAHADPAAELPAALLALDATLGLLGPRGMRRVAAAEFFRGLLVTALAEDELLAEVTVPAAPPGWGFVEIARRPGDFALAGVAVSLDGKAHARVVGFGVADRPVRLRAAEALAAAAPAGSGDAGPGGSGRRGGLRSGHRRPRLGRVSPPPRHRADRGRPAPGDRAPRIMTAEAPPAPAERLRVRLTVNGAAVEREVEARRSLADFLREDLALTGTHVGCEHGVCGACTVLVDGRSARSCLLLAVQLEGARVTTIEGLTPADGLSPLQEAFRACHAMQCGFCTPGMIVASTELLAATPAPDEAAIREALAGNLCMCTGYVNIVRAVAQAAARLAVPAP